MLIDVKKVIRENESSFFLTLSKNRTHLALFTFTSINQSSNYTVHIFFISVIILSTNLSFLTVDSLSMNVSAILI